MSDPTQRPRPTPDGALRGSRTESSAAGPAPMPPLASGRVRDTSPVERIELQPSQVVTAAGSAIVTAARVGKLLGRSGWRLARQLPGARTVEREAMRLQDAALGEARRLLQMPPAEPHPPPAERTGSPDERRAVEHIRHADPQLAPLRSAMGELLERSVEATRVDSRDYLFGTIISQLVPDEARILAALSDGKSFAAADVVQRHRRGTSSVLLANASALGRQAGLTTPENTPTYLTRLLGFGLVELGPEDEDLSIQYDILSADDTVEHAVASAGARRPGSVKIVRRTVRMSALGRDFWAASDPSRPRA